MWRDYDRVWFAIPNHAHALAALNHIQHRACLFMQLL